MKLLAKMLFAALYEGLNKDVIYEKLDHSYNVVFCVLMFSLRVVYNKICRFVANYNIFIAFLSVFESKCISN